MTSGSSYRGTPSHLNVEVEVSTRRPLLHFIYFSAHMSNILFNSLINEETSKMLIQPVPRRTPFHFKNSFIYGFIAMESWWLSHSGIWPSTEEKLFH